MLACFIYKVTQALGVMELRLVKAAVGTATLTVSDLLDEMVGRGIENQYSIVGRIGHNEKLCDSHIRQISLAITGLHSDDLTRVAHVLAKGKHRFKRRPCTGLSGRLFSF